MSQATAQDRPHRPIDGAPPILAIAVALVALLALAGWTWDVEVLKSLLHPGHVAMNPATAIAFLLCAVALWALREDRPRTPASRACAVACAALVLAIAGCRLGAYAGLWHFRFDVVLFPARLHGNVMAPNTAVAFAMMAVALLTMDVRPFHGLHVAQPFLIVTATLALMSLVGYFYDITSLYTVRGAIPMALNTAALFLALSVGALCSRSEREPLLTVLSPTFGGIIARSLIPAAFVIPLLLGGLMLVGWKHELFDPSFGMTLFVLAIILVFNALIWASARVIRQSDLHRQRAAEELRLSEQRYHAIMRQTVEGVYLVDLDTHRILEANGAMARMLGYADGELEGVDILDLINAPRENILTRLEALKATRTPLQGERRYRRKDGSIVEVYAGAAVISYGGRSAACTVVHDITERKRAQRLLQEKHDQLEKAVAAEREAIAQLRLAQSRLVQSEKLASLGQMVAGVAHEINNPLSFVSNNVAILQRDTEQLCKLIALYARADEVIGKQDAALRAEIRDLAERMDLAYTQSNLAALTNRSRDGLRRIQQIVKDLRDFARLDESDLHEVDLNSGIESTVNIVAGRAKKKQVQLQLELKPLPMVTCYPAKVNQVVMNLVANAIDAVPEGGKVSVSSERDGDAVRITVADNGPGVPAAIRDRIFDPFFTTKPQGEGTGLGLSISYGIINDHGGRIEVSDGPAGGAVFIVTLPLCAPPPQQDEKSAGRAGAVTPAAAS